MLAHLTWKTDFEVKQLAELPGMPALLVFYYPPLGDGGHEGVLLQITRADLRWIDCFQSNVPNQAVVIAAPKRGWLLNS